eukprot:Seg1985.4 transcript_id=Seg1985.4/GoldUCD/mRNA.D3Y31 product="hypothetical protein" protein_id=Seg1985.4/GoldUCD/D3Y31
MTMKSVVLLVCIFLTSSINIAQATVTNCTSTPCDIKTCSNTSSKCYQICSVTPCKTECSSPSGCDAKCPIGGCSKMSCSITQRSPAVRSDECGLSCKENCRDMNCNAFRCFPTCVKDNCKMTCDGRSVGRRCIAKCRGKGCEINCKANNCEMECLGGSCKVKVAKNSSGYVECPGGKCSLICAKGSKCGYLNSCPNCTLPEYVEDPFAKPKSNGITVHAAMHILLVTVAQSFISLFL